MKFPITAARADRLIAASTAQQANDKTFQVAYIQHAMNVTKIQKETDEVWKEITAEHSLDHVNHTWEIKDVEGEFFVSVQEAQVD